MSTLGRAIVLLVTTAATAAAVPTITEGGVVNGASFALRQLPQWGIAPGSIFSVFGSGLGPPEIESASRPLPTELGGTSIQVTVGDTTVDALLIFALDSVVAAVLPSTTPTGEGTLTVSFNGETGEPEPIVVVEAALGIFALQQNGQGPAVVTDLMFEANTVVNAFAPGDAAVLWATGLGARSQDEPPVAEDLRDGLDLTLLIGDQPAAISYAGPASCCVGLDQINFVIPPGGEGCAVSVVLQANGRVSNFTSMSISSNGAICNDDPLGLSDADIQKLQTGGSLNAGLVVYDTFFVDAVTVGGPVMQDSPGQHDSRVESPTAQLFRVTSLDVANPVLAIASRSCSVQNTPVGIAPPPLPSEPLSLDEFDILVSVTDPNEQTFPFGPGVTSVFDLNDTEVNPFTFRSGEQWTMDITVVDRMSEQSNESSVSHTIILDPEPLGLWDPSVAEDNVTRMFTGQPLSGDFVIENLPTGPNEFVAGFATVANSAYSTDILCTWPGDESFRIPAHALQSLDCGETLGPCTGSLRLAIIPQMPTINTPDDFFGKLTGFDRNNVFFQVTMPQAGTASSKP